MQHNVWPLGGGRLTRRTDSGEAGSEQSKRSSRGLQGSGFQGEADREGDGGQSGEEEKGTEVKM